MVGPSEILHECTWDPGRRPWAILNFALETNGNERVGTLRFSLWKPSPSALCFFSFKSWWLAGAGLVARGRHLMVPELSSGAPGSPYATIHLRTKMHAGFLLDSGPGGSLARWGGPSVSQVTLRSFLRSPATGGAENDPRVTWDTMGPPKVPKVVPRIFMVGPSENVHETLDGVRGRCRFLL